MEISNRVSVTMSGSDIIVMVDGNTSKFSDVSSVEYCTWRELWSACRNSKSGREQILDDFIQNGRIVLENFSSVDGEKATPVELSAEEYLVRGLKSLINFFSEFEFEPNFRFCNTLSLKLAESKKSAKEYITNYFALMDNSYANEVKGKIASKEFGLILDDIAKGGTPKNIVNKRLKVYYGSAGTGKTTLAMSECGNRCIVANSSMLPSDLMEDFCFVEGKPSFKPSALWECMENGTPIVLDEINLLPFDSLRFLQGCLDGKTEFTYKGRTVHINNGFQIIGTMNLSIGGMTYGLPEPLVDRSADFRKFVLSADDLKKAII